MEARADQLHEEYVKKAKHADGGMEVGTVSPVENKLLSFGSVQGLVFGNYGEVSEATHSLMDAMATKRVRVAGPQKGKKGVMRSEEGEKTVVVGQIRKRVSVAAVRAQCHSLLGRLEVIGPGSPTAAGRRRFAEEQERR